MMTTDFVQQKQQAHVMLDLLTPEKLSAVVGLLDVMLDPVARAIANAEIDEEPISEDAKVALDEAREWLRHNEAIPHEEVLAELGIALEEIENYREPA